MAKAKPNSRRFFRIKDLETGLYYHKRRVQLDRNKGYDADNWVNWTERGDIWNYRGSAETMVTRLTRVQKDKRNTIAKRVLYGDKKSANIIVVECEVKDKAE